MQSYEAVMLPSATFIYLQELYLEEVCHYEGWMIYGVLKESGGWRLECNVRAELTFTHVTNKEVEKSLKNVLDRNAIGEVREGECHDLTSSCMSCIKIN